MVMIDINEYMNSIADKYSNTLGFASDTAEPMANSHSKQQIPGFEEILPCACEDCVDKFYEELDYTGDSEYADESFEEFLAEDLDEATTEVIENLVFMGDGTTSRDVMSAILGLEATIALIKRYLLDSE